MYCIYQISERLVELEICSNKAMYYDVLLVFMLPQPNGPTSEVLPCVGKIAQPESLSFVTYERVINSTAPVVL